MRGTDASSPVLLWLEVLVGLAVVVAVLGGGADGAAPSFVFLVGAMAAAFTGFTLYKATTALVDERLPAHADPEDERAALEYEKRLALSALRELEADVATGKVDSRDQANLQAAAEARALSLIKRIREDDRRWRDVAEAAVGGRPVASAAPAAVAFPKAAEAAPGAESARREAVAWVGTRCTACGFDQNPEDGRFCGGCGRPRRRD